MDVRLMLNHGTKYIYLVDGSDDTAGKEASYSRTATQPWNRVRDGFDNVSKHAEGLPHRPFVGAYPVGERPQFEPEPDLIMSLFSCGFHYPVESYLDWFIAYPRSRVLLDLRVHWKLPDVDGERTMIECGYMPTLIETYIKGKRVIFQR